MPELPEVETVVRDLRPHLLGKKILGVRQSANALRRPWSADWNQNLIQRTVQSVQRRGKWIVVEFDKEIHLLIHLGMTGQLRLWPNKEPVEDHTHLIWELTAKQELRFRDVRRFGSATVFPRKEELDQFFAASRLGPEPFGLEASYWQSQLAKTQRCLKAILLDQQIVAGVGNIYADESLWTARLHPTMLGAQLKPAQIGKLRNAVESVLTRAIEFRGSTIRNYVGGSGLRGGYQDEFAVYGRAGLPCPRCKTEIVRIRLAGRSTHYCEKCQKL